MLRQRSSDATKRSFFNVSIDVFSRIRQLLKVSLESLLAAPYDEVGRYAKLGKFSTFEPEILEDLNGS